MKKKIKISKLYKEKFGTLFENFLEYCKEDNPELAEDIEIWLADYFDLPNRNIPLQKDEKDWIKQNLSEKSQLRILGYKINRYKL